jgi:RND family efflux transporter MFP subunit
MFARPIRNVLLVLILAIGLLAAWVWWQGQEAAPPPITGGLAADPASGPARPGAPAMAEVQVVTPVRRTVVYSITLPANISPHYQTTLYAKVSGYLKWIGPDKGDWVAKDQILAVIDAPEVEEQYQQAIADYKIKKLTFERLQKVWRETPDVIAKQDVDVAEATFQGAKHLMEQRSILRDYTKVRAPYAGIITARFADPGALIQVATASATSAIPLFTIMDIETVRVYTNVPQDDAPLVKAGTPAVVTVKELQNRPFNGAVTRSTLALDPSTRTMLVEIDLPNPDHALQPGTFAEVTLLLRQQPNALVIPAGAIVTAGSAKTVFIADQGRARQIPIRTGISDGKWVEITEGLTGAEEVVVVGKSSLVEGVALRPSPYSLPEGKSAVQKFERRTSGASNDANGKKQSDSAFTAPQQ